MAVNVIALLRAIKSRLLDYQNSFYVDQLTD